jgi:hypothetical protein
VVIDQESWIGERLIFRLRAFGVATSAIIEVFDDRLRIELILPWLLANVAGRLVPALRKEAMLLLEKK